MTIEFKFFLIISCCCSRCCSLLFSSVVVLCCCSVLLFQKCANYMPVSQAVKCKSWCSPDILTPILNADLIRIWIFKSGVPWNVQIWRLSSKCSTFFHWAILYHKSLKFKLISCLKNVIFWIFSKKKEKRFICIDNWFELWK